jgi:hypothetical protein
MATSKKAQNKAGVPSRRRGQQMGDERSAPDNSNDSEKKTLAPRDRRKAANKFFSDDSTQTTGSRDEATRDNSPSVPAAAPTNTKLGESGGEKEFKARQRTAAGKKRK